MSEADYPLWSAALSANRERIMMMNGDSIFEGFSSGGGGFLYDENTLSIPTNTARLLTLVSSRYKAHANAWLGGSAMTATQLRATRTRITGMSGWVDANSGAQVTGGTYNWNFGGGGTPLIYTPSIAFDTVKLHYIGGFADTVTISSSDTATWTGSPLVTGGAARHAIATFTTGTAAVRDLYISSSGAALFVIGVHLYDSTTKRTTIINASYYGSTIDTWLNVSTAYQPGSYGTSNNPVNAIAPDMVVTLLGVNDLTAGMTAANYETKLKLYCDVWKSTGTADQVLWTFPPIKVTGANDTLVRQADFATAVANAAAAKGCGVYDLKARWNTYEDAVVNGFMNSNDFVHPSGLGHIDAATGFVPVISDATTAISATLKLSTAARNARLDALETVIGTSPKLQIRTGSPPADCATASSGTLLVELSLPSDWMNNAANASMLLKGTWTGTASASGTPGYFRIVDTPGTTTHVQGTALVGSGDVNLDEAITSGQTITYNTFSLTDANG